MKKKVIFLGYRSNKTNLIKFLRNKKNIVREFGNKNINKKNIKDSDLIISFGYRKIIKEKILKISKRPILNLHISYLPYNRGSHPNFWSFIMNTPKGVTIHEIDKKIDMGSIVFRKKIIFKKNLDLTFNETHKILIREIEKLFIKNYEKIIDGTYKTKKIVSKGTFHKSSELPKNEESNFNQEIILTKLDKKIIYQENTIMQSLYKSATDKKIPANTIIELARIYGFQVDFQRDIRKKDRFQIMYEVFVDENGKTVETGNILFANLILSGEDNSLYYFDQEGSIGHYDKNGKSIQKALMKTPINGARLSSSFGMRKHPIDGFNKMHRGTDFAAPMGTPIMASGSGTIKKAGWCGGGGNCVVIRHNSTYETIYAHMSKFAKGIKKGIRVAQGQTIGYVGSTGKSTGPHLHYEVVVNGKKVNSQTLKLPSGKILKGEERKIFETKKIKLDVLRSEKILGIN
ncbi:peptidoglycan DD-metalloendopeptidase family protein [Candidatus Pelagibacter bacterium]|nr:peptidoglycan DD-metalloendopeptidase family protein [Candidatus Pelagibacter bacterium]